MKRYLTLILAGSMVLASVVAGCAPDLSKKDIEMFYASGYENGYDWGYWLTAEDKDRTDLFWTPPDKVDEAQKFNPQVNIQDFYIPKGYWTIEDVANARFPDGTPFNDKQKKQAVEANNWGFYDGFSKGAHDYLDGKRHRFLPLRQYQTVKVITLLLSAQEPAEETWI